MNESDSIKKLIMDLASQITLVEHLDTVYFRICPPECSHMDCILVTFYKEKKAVSNIFPINEFLNTKSEMCSFAVNTRLTTMVNKLKSEEDNKDE